MSMSAIDMTIVNVALPQMSNDLEAGIGELQWVLEAFLVSLAGLVLVGGGLADRFGRRPVVLSGLVGFAAASVLTAISQTVAEVIAARTLMGVAAACVLPPALSLRVAECRATCGRGAATRYPAQVAEDRSGRPLALATQNRPAALSARRARRRCSSWRTACARCRR